MKTISLIAASVLALGWGSARADAARGPDTTGLPDDSTTPPPLTNVEVTPDPVVIPSRAPPPTTNVEVTAPPATVDVNVNPLATPAPGDSGHVTDLERHSDSRSWVSRTGGGLFVGGGFQDFTNDNLRTMTGTGGYWSARLVDGMRSIFGVEAAYVGDARNIEALGLGGNARLVSNGVEGSLRLNIPIVSPDEVSLVEPFGFVGLGWAHYNVTNTNVNTSDVASKDDVMTVPVGGGLAFGYRGLMADARFTYRKTYFNNLVTGGNLNNWGIGGQLGFGF